MGPAAANLLARIVELTDSADSGPGAHTAASLARETGLSRQRVSRLLDELAADGLIDRPAGEAGKSRPVTLRIVPMPGGNGGRRLASSEGSFNPTVSGGFAQSSKPDTPVRESPMRRRAGKTPAGGSQGDGGNRRARIMRRVAQLPPESLPAVEQCVQEVVSKAAAKAGKKGRVER